MTYLLMNPVTLVSALYGFVAIAVNSTQLDAFEGLLESFSTPCCSAVERMSE